MTRLVRETLAPHESPDITPPWSGTFAPREVRRDRVQEIWHSRKTRRQYKPASALCPCCRASIEVDSMMMQVAVTATNNGDKSKVEVWDIVRRAVCGRVSCKAGQMTLPMVTV